MYSIKNYDSREDLSNYQVGGVYSFYLHNSSLDDLDIVENGEEEDYERTFSEITKTHPEFMNSDGKYLSFTRAVGIVVEKYKGRPDNVDYISVVFKRNNGEFVLRKYAVNIYNVSTNGKKFVLPTVMI